MLKVYLVYINVLLKCPYLFCFFLIGDSKMALIQYNTSQATVVAKILLCLLIKI